jgi:hypothetical protein
MYRTVLALLALCVLAVAVSAAEYTGAIDKINAKTGAISIKVGDKVSDFDIPFSAKVYDETGKESTGKKRLGIFKPSDEVVITTEKKKVGDVDKEIVIKVERKKK